MYSQSQFGELHPFPTKRKILYRVSKKIYTPEEIEFIRSNVIRNRKGKSKKFLHYCTSIVMMLLIFIMCIILLNRIGQQWTNEYEMNLASVKIQDPAISNYASTVSVIRYFLYNNKTKSMVYINNVAAIAGSTAYTDLSKACVTNHTYYDTKDVMERLKDSLTSPLKLTYDLLFICVMFACMIYILYKTLRPMKIYRIPLVIRSNNISPWSYKQRFKLAAFGVFLIISSFFTRYNMYDYSRKCLYCFDGYSCAEVDSINHASQTFGLCILFPFLALLVLQQFNEKLKYAVMPLILVNGLFMFVIVILTIYSYIVYFSQGAYTVLMVLHILNIIVFFMMFGVIWVVDKYMSSEFDYYEES